MRSEDRTSEQFLGVTQLCQAHNVISWARNQSLPLGATSYALEPITAAEAPPPSMDRRSAAPFGSLATRRLSGTGPRNHASLPFTVGLFPPTAFLHAFPSSFPMALDQKPAEFQLTRVCDSLSPKDSKSSLPTVTKTEGMYDPVAAAVAVPHRYCVTMSPLYLPALRAHTSSSSSPLRRRIEALLTTTLQRSQ